MVSHKKLKEILRNWGFEDEKITDIVYDETGNISESACYVGDNYVIKYSKIWVSSDTYYTFSSD